MTPLDEYRQLMVALFKSRRPQAQGESEDAILDRMDVVWYRMSAEERSAADVLSGRVASGELSEEQFIAMYASEDERPRSPLIANVVIVNRFYAYPLSRHPQETKIIAVNDPSPSPEAYFPEEGWYLGDMNQRGFQWLPRQCPTRVEKMAWGSKTIAF